jgi:uncharacterized protein
MASSVYFIPASEKESTKAIAEKTAALYQKLGLQSRIKKESFVGLKLHFGEKGNKGFIKPLWLNHLIRMLKEKTQRVFLTDSNTLYVGSRSNAVEHTLLAHGHGFDAARLGIPVLIGDGLLGRQDDEIDIRKDRIQTAKIAGIIKDTDILLNLSHFTGHVLTGFGGAIKNIGMGCASRAGKLDQHSDVHPHIDPGVCKNCGSCAEYCPADAIVEKGGKSVIQEEKCIGCGECLVACTVGAVKIKWDSDKQRVQEKMAEYAWTVHHLLNGSMGCLTFLIRITKDCDCMAKAPEPIIEDIGILASPDTVAIDQAAVDLVIDRSGSDVLKEQTGVDWELQLQHGEKLGLGTRKYELIDIS